MGNEPPPLSGSGQPLPPPALGNTAARVESVGDYGIANFVQRPGILTAVGIVSIVVACMGLLSGCLSIFGTMITGAASSSVVTTTTISSSSTTSTSYVYSSVYSSPGAAAASSPSRMRAENKNIVIDTVNQLTPLSETRKQMLDQLLDDTGDDPFPFGQSNFTPQSVKGSISNFGTVVGSSGNQYFSTPNGRVEIGNEMAVFSPTRGDSVTVFRNNANSSTSAPASSATSAFVMPMPQFSRTEIALNIAAAVLNVLMAGFLLMCGILVLKDSTRGRKAHLVYAALKLPLIAFGTLVAWWWMKKQYAAMAGAPGALISSIMWISVIVQVLFSAAYPVALLIIMTRPSIKAYYAAPAPTGAAA